MRLIAKSQFAVRVTFPGSDRGFMRTIFAQQVVNPMGGDLYTIGGQSMHIPDVQHLLDNGFLADLDAKPMQTPAHTIAQADRQVKAQEIRDQQAAQTVAPQAAARRMRPVRAEPVAEEPAAEPTPSL